MRKKRSPPLEGELLQGTLDLLILQTLVLGPTHGHTIAYAIEHRSDDALPSSGSREREAQTCSSWPAAFAGATWSSADL